ncbi:hypothetical protein EDB87DRAFT_1640837 [Lactarius vividus]|nr:hypothetical protein EDB87DRAFT_1640837 [Lactarius vividus]
MSNGNPPQIAYLLEPLLSYISSCLPPPVYHALAHPRHTWARIPHAVRTATWFVRMTTWIIKWGIITAAVSAATAWVFASGGVVPSLTGLAAKTPAGGLRGSRQRPQAWDSFDQHWEWQFEEKQWNTADATSPSQHVQQFVADALQRARDGGLWSIARGALQSFSDPRPSEREGDSYDNPIDSDGEPSTRSEQPI